MAYLSLERRTSPAHWHRVSIMIVSKRELQDDVTPTDDETSAIRKENAAIEISRNGYN